MSSRSICPLFASIGAIILSFCIPMTLCNTNIIAPVNFHNPRCLNSRSKVIEFFTLRSSLFTKTKSNPQPASALHPHRNNGVQMIKLIHDIEGMCWDCNKTCLIRQCHHVVTLLINILLQPSLQSPIIHEVCHKAGSRM